MYYLYIYTWESNLFLMWSMCEEVIYFKVMYVCVYAGYACSIENIILHSSNVSCEIIYICWIHHFLVICHLDLTICVHSSRTIPAGSTCFKYLPSFRRVTIFQLCICIRLKSGSFQTLYCLLLFITYLFVNYIEISEAFIFMNKKWNMK